jgi:iron complex outermembrane receptor protein
MLSYRAILVAALLAVTCCKAVAEGVESSAQDDDLAFLLESPDEAAKNTDVTDAGASSAGSAVAAGTVAEPEALADEPQAPTPEPPDGAMPENAEAYESVIPVGSDDPPKDELAKAKPQRRIEEIVVTAQKREESLQDVPIAITAFSGDSLVAKGITDTQQLAQATPGLVYASNAGYAQAYIRGIGSDATLPTADPSVATYIDGIYYPMVQSTIQSFANVERIEVLKGPQGTLFGRNTTGGAINVITKDPGQESEYSTLFEVANYGHMRLSLYGSTPVTDSLAVSLSGFVERADSYYEQNNPTGPEILDTQNWGVRVKVAYNSGSIGSIDNINAVLSAYALDHHGADTNIVNQFRPSVLSTALGGSPTTEPYQASTDLPDTNYTRIEGVNFKATANLPYFDLVSISGYQNVENFGTVDYDATASAEAGFGAHPGLSESFSQELQLVSNAWDDVDFVAGGYYFTGSAGFVPLNFGLTAVIPTALADAASPLLDVLLPILQSTPPVQIPSITIPNTPEIVADLLDTLGNALPLEQLILRISELGLLDLPGNSAYVAIPLVSIVDTEAYAAFSQVTWRVADWLNLTAGLRYSNEKRTLVRNDIYAPLVISDPRNFDQIRGLQGTPLISRPSRDASWDDLSTKFVIEFPFADLGFIDSGMVYLGRTEGFKSGTWNVVALTDTPLPVEPEDVTSWEGGFKTDMLNGSLRFNGSLFQYDYQNLQLQTIALTSGGAVRLENAGSAKLKGADLDAIVAPADWVQLSMGATFLESEFTVCNCSGFQEDTGLGFRGDFSGNELVNAPPFTANADLSFMFGVTGGDVELAGTYYYNEGHWFDAQNTFKQEAYGLIGARASYTHSRSNIRITVYGQNLADERYLLNGNVNDFGRFGTYAAPRTYGLRLQWPAS